MQDRKFLKYICPVACCHGQIRTHGAAWAAGRAAQALPATRHDRYAMTTLTDLLPPASDSPPDPDAIFSAFAGWAKDSGLSLYPHQEEGLIDGVVGSNLILSPPTGSGKSLVATGAHFTALANGQRSYYTAPIKALVSEKFFSLIDVFGPGSG